MVVKGSSKLLRLSALSLTLALVGWKSVRLELAEGVQIVRVKCRSFPSAPLVQYSLLDE